MDIAHPMFWVDKGGSHPTPFSTITADDVKNGVWMPVQEAHLVRSASRTETTFYVHGALLYLWACFVSLTRLNLHYDIRVLEVQDRVLYLVAV